MLNKQTAFGLATQSGTLLSSIRFDPELEDDVVEGEEDDEIVHEESELPSRIKKLEENQVLQTLMADDDVRRVLEMKRLGKKPKISDES